MMKAVLKLLDVKTLVAGAIPVVMGSLYSLYRFDVFSVLHMFILMIGIILMQSSANMINDLCDFKRGADDEVKADEKALVSNEITVRQVKEIIAVFLTIVMGILIYYTINVSWAVLCIGFVGGVIMYAYSAGNRPISYTCFGEITAGLTMGTGIMATVIYIQAGIISLETILVTLPTTIYIGTILLTNNISDCAEDRKSGRRTLPIVVGPGRSEKIWISSCVGLLVLTSMFAYFGIWPLESLILVLVFYPYTSLISFDVLEKNAKNKGRLMALIGKIGIGYHLPVALGFVLSEYTSL